MFEPHSILRVPDAGAEVVMKRWELDWFWILLTSVLFLMFVLWCRDGAPGMYL